MADKFNRPVRIMLDRDEDMLITGHRHSFWSKYTVGFDKSGKILALDVDFYSNAGYTIDLSAAVMERALSHADNAYNIGCVHAKGYLCKTNLPSNTAFRGFGGPQAMLVAEDVLDQVSTFLKRDPVEIRRLNLYKEGDIAYTNQVMENCTLDKCFIECLAQSRYAEQAIEIKEFNQCHRWKKRGISIIPTKYMIGFGFPTANQGGSLVKIYKDGSVLVAHGGCEIGQGLHTKMIQVASQALGVDHNRIHIMETATDKVPNMSPTAASMSSDLYGMAILNACEIISERLRPIKEKMPDKRWNDWIFQAWFDRICLFSSGFYASPGLNYDHVKNEGRWFNYSTYGVGASVIEIDCLTGDHSVLRTDIVMDLGESLNPAIDIGQVEGAFTQGYGMFMMEQLIHSPEGNLLTRGPGAYKIPGFGDIPSEFNVSLLRGSSNPRAVFSSKAVGEPPLFLAASVYYAAKEAVRASRRSAGVENPDEFDLPAPATAERIRDAIQQIKSELQSNSQLGLLASL
jgi:xanthine dehydrogenase/oxidase